ncbi:MAG: class A beta-lactamase-related serine hydrolase [Candidatus Gastranaerophilales bacterium]|nr:class A beta-lactamase-related serine hydrolase [Candidatus Gastranaerophilales bacterium]
MQKTNARMAQNGVFTDSDMVQNINFTQTYPYTYTQGFIKPIKKTVPVKKKINSLVTVFVVLLMFFVSTFVLPFAHKNFFMPLFASPNPFRVDIEKIYSPTSSYLHNNEFLGSAFLIGAKTQNAVMDELKLTSNMPVLEKRLAALAGEYKMVSPSVFVWDYETGKYAGYNSKQAYPAASIIKLPVLLQLFRSTEAGQLDINDKMTLTDYYRAEGSGDLQFQKEGNLYTLDSLARKMIEISDNSSTNMIMSSIGGMNDVNRAVKSWGLKNTEVNNWLPDMGGTNVTTTEDLARMLFNIENENFLSKESKDKILDYMGHVKNNRLIHAGLNPNAKFYHKTGDIGHTLGDAGIVVTPDGHKYIVCMMAKRPYNHPAGKEFIVRASELIYNSVANRNLT